MASSVRYSELKSDPSHDSTSSTGVQYITVEKIDATCYLIFQSTFPVTKGTKNFEVLMEPILDSVPDIRNRDEGVKVAKRIADQLRVPFISKKRTIFTVIRNENEYIPFEIIEGAARQAGLIGSSLIDVTMKTKEAAKNKGSKFIEPKSIKTQKRAST